MTIVENWNWQPPGEWLRIKTVDLHTGGEPLRVYLEGLPEIKGQTILEQRRYFRDRLDYIRTSTLLEPRGHGDMYGAVITSPVSEDADFGTFFLHNEGYSTMCGHAIIALTKLVLDTGLIDRPGVEPELVIDAPAGKIRAKALRVKGRVAQVSFLSVPAFLYLRDQTVDVPEIGPVSFDEAFGGAFYALIAAEDLGIGLTPENYPQLIDWGHRIKHAILATCPIAHPFEPDLSFLYGTIFSAAPDNPSHHSRNVCIFADGQLDRSATGSGVSARAAQHHARGDLEPGRLITIESILGSTMAVRVVETTTFGPYAAVIPEVTGQAWITGSHEFWVDPSDPLKAGFILR